MSSSEHSDEKPAYEPEISEDEGQDPRRQTKQKGRKKEAPQWAQDQAEHGTNLGPYTGGEDRRDKAMKSRIKDREATSDAKDSSLKIKIELDLEAEVNLYARVKGDITIGLL
ncbi:uncharacterized protein DNG_08915 [Cephalotrichum gorgonifer]|uniref:Uncharacterized protein n=1 Tax=Cephalotrichum gorgonifer TaxID=2041049 RepID=A0AAE8SYT9_9PEZI|nr:uncharacterized protein DNG_08915 [Cephalotrichum gorgonifer]